MTPRIIDTGMGYTVLYLDDLTGDAVFTFELESVESTGWGIMATVTARTNITTARTFGSGYLTTERVNLLSSKSRSELARRLASLVPTPAGAAAIEWERLCEQVSLLVMEQERRPVVPVDLSAAGAAAPVEYLVPSLIPMRKATILYAAGGTGKGWFAAALSTAVQTGMGWLGWPVRQANVLYCDWESDQDDLSTRVAMTSRGMGLTSPAPVHYARFISPLERHQADVARMVKDLNIGLLVVDSTGAAMAGGSGGDQASEAQRFFKLFRHLGCAVLAIDHIAGDDVKRGAHGAAKPYGSVYKWNAARNAFNMWSTTDEGVTPQVLVVKHMKNNLGPRIAPVTLEARWGPDWMRYQRSATPGIIHTPLDDRIFDAISAGSADAHELTRLLNLDINEREVNEYDVRNAINELRANGVVKVGDDGRVSIAIDPEQMDMGMGEDDDRA